MVEPVMVGLSFLRADVAAPCRAELEHIEVERVRDVVVAALQYAIEPPLHRARRHVRVPLDAMPRTERHRRRVDVRMTPAEVARVLGHNVEVPIGNTYQKLLAPGTAAPVEDERDLVPVGPEIERRVRLPPERGIHLLLMDAAVIHGPWSIALDHSLRIHEVVYVRGRERGVLVRYARDPSPGRSRGGLRHDPPARAARDQDVAGCRRILIQTPIGEEGHAGRLV